VAKIEHPEVMDESGQRQKVGGLMDPKMGSTFLSAVARQKQGQQNSYRP
jgi:DNA-directed RNA polymerase beta' subunit